MSIYIVLTQTNTVVSRLIKLNTKNPYNHVSISFDKDLTNMYSFGRYFTSNPVLAGFIKENAKKGLYKIKPKTQCCIYEVVTLKESYEKLEKFINEYKKNWLRHRFNFLGVVSLFFNLPFRRKYKRFCAEFVSEALHVSGIYETKISYALARPHDFHFVKNANKIYEGLLKDYK
jgi:hypothetical protein